MIKDLKRATRVGKLSKPALAKLGGGEIAYIRSMTAAEAGRLFPAISGIPKGIALFALHAADGTPICLADSHNAALAHAMNDDLFVASLH
jgi:hypothetical protein